MHLAGCEARRNGLPSEPPGGKRGVKRHHGKQKLRVGGFFTRWAPWALETMHILKMEMWGKFQGGGGEGRAPAWMSSRPCRTPLLSPCLLIPHPLSTPLVLNPPLGIPRAHIAAQPPWRTRCSWPAWGRGLSRWPGDRVPLTVFFLRPRWGWALLAILLLLLLLQHREREGQCTTQRLATLSLRCLTPGHIHRRDVPQQHGDQKRVSVSVKEGQQRAARRGGEEGTAKGQPDHAQPWHLSLVSGSTHSPGACPWCPGGLHRGHS